MFFFLDLLCLIRIKYISLFEMATFLSHHSDYVDEKYGIKLIPN